jgi:hypothetical protein
MIAWLVCEKCGTKEAVLPQTEMDGGCKLCGGNRSRCEDSDGNPVFLLSGLEDPEDWSVTSGSGDGMPAR